jgi:exodeoxyribonuclease VII large subunit
MNERASGKRKIWTVSELNRAARDLLEDRFSRLWLEGEISNFKAYPSGHAYFSLKDEEGQISAAMFRFASRNLRFKVRDGLAVLAAGSVTVYDKRGQYQFVVDELEPKGKGSLQLAYEQLKEKLRAEGLFDEDRKRPLPELPRTVGVVTSSRGAAVRDILHVLRRRFANLRVIINPVKVQGDGAAEEIAAAIGEFNAMGGIDEEVVARAIAASEIPVVSAVGHETDFTIADFAADLRAPTPSAAAELVVRNKADLEEKLVSLERGLAGAVGGNLAGARHRLESLAVGRMITDMKRWLRELAQSADDFHRELERGAADAVARRKEGLRRLREALSHLSPRARQTLLRQKHASLADRLRAASGRRLAAGREAAALLAEKLGVLSPLSVLARGYSICRLLPSLEVVKDAAAVSAGSEVTVRLSRGDLRCRVGESHRGDVDSRG